MASKRIIWTPQPRQAEFMRRPEYEALYGGAAGGGKSDALVIEALRQVHIPHYKALVLRKTYPQLSELIEKSQGYYPRAFSKARYNSGAHFWTFPSGAKIIFGSMQRVSDRVKYQGKAFDFIAFDELTHFTWDEYSYMFSRNRANGPGTRVYIRASANPGGIGHGWVKERFITAAPAMTPIMSEIRIRCPNGRERVFNRSRIFIPSSVFDNKKLLENDPEYLSRLGMLSEAEKKALLYGDWDCFEGQVFTEWRNNSEHYRDRINTHVISPFRIPKSWQVFRGFDFGYSKPFSVGWFAADHDGRIYRIRELYGCSGEPNVGVKWEPSRIAHEIQRIEREDNNLKDRLIRGIADPSIFDESRGQSIAAMMERAGVFFDRGDNTRIAGKMQFHFRLRFDENGIPMFYCFSTCKNFIRTVPALVYSRYDVEDVDTAQEDHIYDEARYVLMENPISPHVKANSSPGEYNPLEDDMLTDNNVAGGLYQWTI